MSSASLVILMILWILKIFMPLIGVAVIYLVMVMFFTWLVGILERRLRDSER